jgi:hypothetical protein
VGSFQGRDRKPGERFSCLVSQRERIQRNLPLYIEGCQGRDRAASVERRMHFNLMRYWDLGRWVSVVVR